jgi:hypothetical protein
MAAPAHVGEVSGPAARGIPAGTIPALTRDDRVRAHIWDPDGSASAGFALTAPPATLPTTVDLEVLRGLVVDHGRPTGSRVASRALASWDWTAASVWVLGHPASEVEPSEAKDDKDTA